MQVDKVTVINVFLCCTGRYVIVINIFFCCLKRKINNIFMWIRG